ncbi:MAG: ATP-binding cassette domain-containing protein [Firmicutes bacterium]|nr:ATP-binding cassette domain-containing protein [Bacillota bacterium]
MQIKINNLVLKYDGEVVLKVDDIVFDGVLGLTGGLASGKSSLLKAIAGLEQIESGSICFDGTQMATLNPKKRNVSLINIDTFLFLNKNAIFNLQFPLKKRGFSQDQIGRLTEQSAAEFDIDFLNTKTKNLSDKQKIDLLFARATIKNPTILLVDEFDNLCPKLKLSNQSQTYFYDRLKSTIAANKQKNKNFCAIIVSKDLTIIAPLADNMLTLKCGKILSLKSRPKTN